MIDLTDYPLIYICKTTGKQFRGKKSCTTDTVLVDPETFEKERLTAWECRKRFRSGKKNRTAAIKPAHARPKMFSKSMNSKAFQEYLNGESV